jgi:hypothetical protein
LVSPRAAQRLAKCDGTAQGLSQIRTRRDMNQLPFWRKFPIAVRLFVEYDEK